MNRRGPLSTYRLQLHAAFGFEAAGSVAEYLRDLGVSHVYSSPYLQAAKGSVHGYDVVDHSRVNEELGGEAQHRAFCETLGFAGLGQVLDIVPNHMAIGGRENSWWWDVLENGPASPFASYFDVDWNPPEEKLRNKILVPILGEHYGRVLGAGEIQLRRREGSFEFHYFDHVVPTAPRSMSDLLAEAAREAGSDYLAFLSGSLARLPLPTITDRQRLLERHRDKEVIRGLLRRLCEECPDIAGAIDHAIQSLNGNVDRMDELLERQNYRVSFWKTAGRELGHRRFFDVNTLVGLRMESETVFEDTHRLLRQWVERGVIDGLRVDHPDGLRDPEEYFDRLSKAAPAAWVVAEKILEPGERLRENWAVAGTTGYDFLNILNGVFVDPAGEAEMTGLYGEFTGEPVDFGEVAHQSKLLVLREVLGSDVNRLSALFLQICEGDRDHRDYMRHDIHRAIRELIACFPVYRTYARVESNHVEPADLAYIQAAVELAKSRRPDIDPDLFAFLGRVLSLQSRGFLESEFVMAFQQFSGPAMAKGVEDTAFYRYNRLTSLNDVGGDPGRFGVSLRDFHAFCLDAQQSHPQTMTSTSTHDTKRSEDVRARINLLSEMPAEWGDALRRWSLATEGYLENGLPDRNTIYLLFQTLVGAWPISTDRLQAYMLKACREAKQQTSWLTPKEEFETSLHRFIGCLCDDAALMGDVNEFVNRLEAPGRINSLAQTLVKLTAPGVPDIYQGTELWDLSLVDPDNRRPVDYDLRKRLLAELRELDVEAITARFDEGLPKMWTIQQALHLRRERPKSFGMQGSYLALYAAGEKAEHVLAFQRSEDVIAVVPRFPHLRGGRWSGTALELPDGDWLNRLTGERYSGGRREVEHLLSRFPVALLTLENSGR